MQGDELPTYANSEAASGNSGARWHRWRGWVEKRAAERYAEEGYQKPPATGWGASYGDLDPAEGAATPPAVAVSRTSTLLSLPPDYENEAPTPPPGQLLDPSCLGLYTFGSRFLPHSSHPITSILPILGGKFILIGTTNGLSVLDVFPSLHTASVQSPITSSLQSSPPLSDAVAIQLWHGEAIHQLSLLEEPDQADQEGGTSGIVLAVVNQLDDQDNECGNRVVRLYNLASLVNLVRWATSQTEHAPLDLHHRNDNGVVLPSPVASPRTVLRKHKHQRSGIRQSLKALIIDSHASSSGKSLPLVSPVKSSSQAGIVPYILPPASGSTPSSIRGHSSVASPTSEKDRSRFFSSSPLPPRPPTDASSGSSISSEASLSTWDIVDDLPFRWATDFATFATAATRLANVSVQFMEVWKDTSKSKSSAFLAVATKTNILLYESPKEERAFRFIKEFYTPVPARSVTFVHQADPKRKKGSVSHSRSSSKSSSRSSDPGPQLSLFVTFEKKAGLIRVADSAVTEVEPFLDMGLAATSATQASKSHHRHTSSEASAHISLRKSLASSLDGGAFWRGTTPWLPLSELQLPPGLHVYYSNTSIDSPISPQTPQSTTSATSQRTLDAVCFLTRGQTTQILPLPLPVSSSSATGFTSTPLRTLIWHTQPARVVPRLCIPPPGLGSIMLPFIQIIGFGPDGVEVQEIPLDFIVNATEQQLDGKGKGKVKSQGAPPEVNCLRTCADVGGAATFVGTGGNGDRPPQPFDSSPTAAAAHVPPQSIAYLLHQANSLNRQDSFISTTTTAATLVDHHHLDLPTSSSQGVYGMVAKAPEDYRIFWLGSGWDLLFSAEPEAGMV